MSNDRKSVRIPSTGWCHTPGVVDFARRALQSDDPAGFGVLASIAWAAPSWVLVGLISGAYSVEGDCVVVEQEKVEALGGGACVLTAASTAPRTEGA